MKKLVAVMVWTALFQLRLLADDALLQQTPHVLVSGTAVMEVVPNVMSWTLQVRNTEEKLEDVATNHSKLVAGLLGFLKDSGINIKAVQTSRMEFGENWEWDGQKRQQKGYFASTTVTFKLADLTLYQKLWTGLATQTGVSVQGVVFDYGNRLSAQNDVRAKALLAARDKAKLLANTLGCSIGDPLMIEDQSGEDDVVAAGPRFAFTRGGKMAGDSGESLAPGTIPIRSTVQASFRLTPGLR